MVQRPFKRVAYDRAIELLQKSGKKFEYPVDYGANLQSEHERYLTEVHFKRPVTVFNFPKEIKPFYMRANDDDKTVAAMDLLVPNIGEIVGGSQREERLDVLAQNLQKHGLDAKEYWWYLELRQYGTAEHSGFGLGFERMLMFVTGMGQYPRCHSLCPNPRECRVLGIAGTDQFPSPTRQKADWWNRRECGRSLPPLKRHFDCNH